MFEVLSQFDKYLDVTLICIIIASSLWAKKKLKPVFPKVDMSLKILIWSTIVTIVYFFTLQKTGVLKIEEFPVYVISYSVATSFYELGIKFIADRIKSVLSPNKDK